MRTLFVLFIIAIPSLHVFAQNDRTPSQAKIQEQVKQAKIEAQKQVAEMETEIATAKKNNEDPETIREMEKNLATLKKMFGILDNVAGMNNKKRPETFSNANTVPAYKSPYVRFFNGPVAIPSEAQAKDRLLWYRGKKINQNTLITTRGRVIRYDRQNNKVVVQLNEKKDTATLKIIARLKKTREWTNNYVNNEAARKNSFFDYPLVMMAMKEFDLIEQEFNKFADNSIELPGNGSSLMTAYHPMFPDPERIGGPNTNAIDSLDPEEWIRQTLQEIKNLRNNPPPLDFPPPPRHEYDLCFYCDQSKQEQFYKDKDAWSTKFNEYEAKLISRCLSMERQFQLLGNGTDENPVPPDIKAVTDEAMGFAFQRVDQKVKLLEQRYSQDVFRQECVVTMLLSIARQKQLLGYADEQGVTPDLQFLNIFGTYIKDRIAARDYNVIFNYALILGHERQEQLLGVAQEGHEMDLEMEVWALNRFALTVDINFDIEYQTDGNKPILKANGSLSTAQKIYVKLGVNKNCKWQFYLYDPDYASSLTQQQEMLFKIPMVVNSGIKQVLKNETWITYPYTGPKDLEMNFPSFRISFCQNAGQDSAMMDILRYKGENVTGDVANSYTVDLLGYLDKILVSVSATKANQDQVVDVIGQMTTISNQATVDKPTGYGKLDKMQVDYKLNGIQHDLKKRVAETTKVGNTVILFDAKNGDTYLINGQTNTAHTELAIKVNTGLIKLKVVLEPL
jgi:hypothetical protein